MTPGKTYIRWLILLLIVIASGVSYILRINISVVGDAMIADLGLTELQLGMIFSASAAGYAIFQFPGGLFGEKVGARFAMTALAIAWGVLTILTALVPGSGVVPTVFLLGMLIVVRFLVNAVHAPIFPITCGGVISRWFPVGSWGLPNGLSSTGLTLGAAATGPLLVWLMESYGWRGSLLITSPVAFIMALAWWVIVRNDPAEHPMVGPGELTLINAGRRTGNDGIGTEKGAWKLVLKNRDILLLTVAYFCMNYIFYLFFNWFFYYLVEVKHFASQEAGMLMAALWILGAVGATAGGFTCDRLIKHLGFRWGPAGMAVTALTLSAVLLVLGAVADDPYTAVILLCACFACNQITEAAFWATAIAVSGEHAAAATGVMNTGGNSVGFIGGMLVPLTAAWLGWVAAISTGAVFAVIGAILWLMIRGDRPMTADSHV